MPKTLFLIGTLPPPVTGQSVLFSLLTQRLSEHQVKYRVINTALTLTGQNYQGFSWNRAISLVPSFLHALPLIFYHRTTVYMTIANSWNGFLKDLVFLTIARIRGHRIIVHCHGGNYKEFYSQSSLIAKWLIRTTIGSADSLVILSNVFRPDFYFLKDFNTKIVVVANGLTHTIPSLNTLTSTNTEIPLCLRAEQPHHLRILFFSNLIETKGYLVLLEAVNILVNQYQISLSAHFCGEFLLVGSTPSYPTVAEAEADFRVRIQNYGLAENVVVRGSISGEEKHRELLEGDIFVLPTTYQNEAQPVAIIEALAYGCTVISTPHRAIPEMLDYGKAGILIEPNRADLIADQILKIQKEPTLLSEYGRRARQQYLRCFRPETHWDNKIGRASCRERV